MKTNAQKLSYKDALLTVSVICIAIAFLTVTLFTYNPQTGKLFLVLISFSAVCAAISELINE